MPSSLPTNMNVKEIMELARQRLRSSGRFPPLEPAEIQMVNQLPWLTPFGKGCVSTVEAERIARQSSSFHAILPARESKAGSLSRSRMSLKALVVSRSFMPRRDSAYPWRTTPRKKVQLWGALGRILEAN